MPRNPYFKDYSGEQTVTEDITIETIQTLGRDMVYIPRNRVSKDDLFGEDISTKFDAGINLEMYIQSVDGFEGEGDVVSQYGLQIKDRIEFIVSRRRFNEEVKMLTGQERPLEGDLVYFPLSKTLFEINFVEHENPFYQLGKLYTYRLSCETFVYDAGQELDTGIAEVDVIEDNIKSIDGDTITIQDSTNSTSSGDNDTFDTLDDNIFDFSESDPFSEGNY
jgi:hypothetical protein